MKINEIPVIQLVVDKATIKHSFWTLKADEIIPARVYYKPQSTKKGTVHLEIENYDPKHKLVISVNYLEEE